MDLLSKWKQIPEVMLYGKESSLVGVVVNYPFPHLVLVQGLIIIDQPSGLAFF